MEVMLASSIRAELAHTVEWPKVPQTSLTESRTEIPSSEPQAEETIARQTSCDEETETGRPVTNPEQASTEQGCTQKQETPPQEASTAHQDITPQRVDLEQESTKQQELAGERGVPAVADNPAPTEARRANELPASRPRSHSKISQAANLSAISNTVTAQTPSTPVITTAESSKPQNLAKRVTTLSRLSFVKNQWLDPHLSIGAKCNRLGGNECWKAIGPAQNLFKLISKRIEDLLDARVDDLEEGEPIAGHILLFDLYMIGRTPASAQPTLLFTCQRPKPRRRAIKFVKESGILKGHPKIALAESAVPPLVMGTSYVRLLAGQATYDAWGRIANPLPTSTVLVPRQTFTSTPSSLSEGAKVGIGISVSVISLLFGFLGLLLIYRRLAKRTTAQIPDSAYVVPPDSRYLHMQEVSKPNAHKTGYSTVQGLWTLQPTYEMGDSINHSARLIYSPPANPGSSDPSNEMGGKDNSFVTDPKLLLLPTKTSSNSLYKLPIICSSTTLRSTIGGILHSKGKFYGLTVSHIFGNSFQPFSASETFPSHQGEDSEFAFDEDDQDYQENENSDVAITSQASRSFAESTESVSTSGTTISIGPRGRGERSSLLVETVLQYEDDSNASSSSYVANNIGTLAISSAQETQLGLDWALVELSESIVERLRSAFVDEPLAFVPRRIAFTLEQSVTVIASTGYSGTLMGTISPGFTLMKLSPRSKFQEVWTVTFDKPLNQGDSGSWVVDKTSGVLYGHIVAGIPEGRIAYIIPAFKIFKDVQQEIGTFQFASEIIAAEAAESHDRAKAVPAQGVTSEEAPRGSHTPVSTNI